MKKLISLHDLNKHRGLTSPMDCYLGPVVPKVLECLNFAEVANYASLDRKSSRHVIEYRRTICYGARLASAACQHLVRTLISKHSICSLYDPIKEVKADERPVWPEINATLASSGYAPWMQTLLRNRWLESEEILFGGSSPLGAWTPQRIARCLMIMGGDVTWQLRGEALRWSSRFTVTITAPKCEALRCVVCLMGLDEFKTAHIDRRNWFQVLTDHCRRPGGCNCHSSLPGATGFFIYTL